MGRSRCKQRFGTSTYISHKSNIRAVYPFKEDGLVLRDIEEILRTSGVGMPPYTKWGRTRSGCYFCFYQQKIEWVRLKEAHPDLYEKAKAYEKPYEKTGNFFTWSQGESLAEMEEPVRVEQIRPLLRRYALNCLEVRLDCGLQTMDQAYPLAEQSQFSNHSFPQNLSRPQGCKGWVSILPVRRQRCLEVHSVWSTKETFARGASIPSSLS